MKEEIIEQSIKLFARQGFKETSIQDMMNELNVTKGTFYYYFKNKEELLMEIHRQYIERLVENQELIKANNLLTSKEKLHEIVLRLIQGIKKEGSLANVVIREMRHLNGEHREKIVLLRDRFRKNIEELVRDGIEKGEFRSDLPPDIVAFGILGMTNWSYFWFQPDGKMTDDEVARIFFTMIIEGIQLK